MKLYRDFGIRALLGTVIVVGTTITLALLAVRGSGEALTGLVAMAASVTGFYFGSRGTTPPNPPTP